MTLNRSKLAWRFQLVICPVAILALGSAYEVDQGHDPTNEFAQYAIVVLFVLHLIMSISASISAFAIWPKGLARFDALLAVTLISLVTFCFAFAACMGINGTSP